VRHWLDGGERHDDTDKALAAFGLVIESGAETSDAPFAVYTINWPALSIFWATWNQWKKIAVGTNIIKVCIDWAQVEAALKMSGIERSEWPLIFEGLRAAETEALEWLNKD
jgi:hypothetical protein